MTTSSLQIRIDPNLRKEAEALFSNAGLDMSSAIRLFLRQSVIRRRLPFEVITESTDPFLSATNAFSRRRFARSNTARDSPTNSSTHKGACRADHLRSARMAGIHGLAT